MLKLAGFRLFREYSTRPAHNFGVAFDIDGVLIKGKQAIPQAHRAISLLKNHNIPFIFVTNGGGVTEEKRTKALSNVLGIEFSPEQMVLSHSPMRTLSQKYGNDNVLVVGKDDCKEVALSYNFKSPILTQEIHSKNRSLWPHSPIDPPSNTFVQHNDPSLPQILKNPFSCILIFHDPRNWGRDLQITIDLLLSQDGVFGTIASPESRNNGSFKQLPVYVSNPDFQWANEYHLPRFAQGAFHLCLERLYEECTGLKLNIKRFGKPVRETYEFASGAIERVASMNGHAPIPARKMYAVGDNPASDIAGAKDFGWESFLVRTGVWNADYHGHSHGATHVVDNVEVAVEKILELEGLTSPGSSQESEKKKKPTTNSRAKSRSKNDDDSDEDLEFEQNSALKSKSSTKRSAMVLDDDDDDDVVIVEEMPKVPKPQITKPAPKKAKGEESTNISPSAFFAMSSNNKPAKKDEPPKSEKNNQVDHTDEEVVTDIDDDANILPMIVETPPSPAKTKSRKLPWNNPKPAPSTLVESAKSDADTSKLIENASDEPVSKSNNVSPVKPTPVKSSSSVSTPTKRTNDDKTEDDSKRPKYNFYALQAQKAAVVKNYGSKQIPDGAENCLLGMTFVLTGELSSISREDAMQLIKRHGGRITTAPSSKTTYAVVGEAAGPKKLEKMEELKIKKLNEDELFELIRTAPAKSEATASPAKGKAALKKGKSTVQKKEEAYTKPVVQQKDDGSKEEPQLWTVKYAPQSYQDLIGNKTNVDKLSKWLKDWKKNLSAGFPKGDISSYRSVLMSGPPGIGKTTTAHLVAKMEGYDVKEYNASDVRSRKMVEQFLGEAIDGHVMTEFFKSDKNQSFSPSLKPSLIIMDEIDGMSAGDRGGTTELIKLIKKTKVPMICICNDRMSPKVKSLANHCLELRFMKPSAAVAETRLKWIAKQEGLEIKPEVVGQLLEMTGGDIRQILNLLSTYRISQQSLSFDQAVGLSKTGEKNVTLGLWTLAERLLDGRSYRNMSFNEKMELYFLDYDMLPLMVQENYLRNTPALARESAKDEKSFRMETINLMSQAASSMSDGELIGSMIRGGQHWSLMNVHNVFSCVRPSFFIHGQKAGQLGFSSYLGQLSKKNKNLRILKDLQMHMRLHISGDKYEVRNTYLPTLAMRLTNPLKREGTDMKQNYNEIIELMDEYYLSRDDYENILEMGMGDCSKDNLMMNVPTAVKSGFTRAFNSANHPVPTFMVPLGSKKGRGSLGGGMSGENPDLEEAVDLDQFDEEEENEGSDDDLETFAKKIKKSAAKKSATSTKASGSGSKGKKK
ncbi:hypothetical protein HK098_006941 [Nowakowskiella sp. JEL0407]|nr:hypothetical protein HK098_006932 [Nowakowskiella sp. JEL0407]KAJ3126983.1 hypothetical protein HK098_006941 [Nowakowskiella sp. JEL0407]